MKSFDRMSKVLVAAILAFSIAAPLAAQAAEIDVAAPRAGVTEIDGGLEVRTGNLVFKVDDPSPGSPERALYDELSDEDKVQFLRKRKAGVLLVARVLNAMKYGFGVGAIIKDRLSFKAADRDDDKLLESVRRADPAFRTEVTAIVERERVARFERQNAILKQTMKERAEVMIASMVRTFDKSIWSQAPVYSHSNEHAFYGGLGVGGLGKASKGRRLGGLFEIGISIGYNIEQKAVVIQLIRDVESFRDSMMPVMVFGGVYFKAGYYFANQQKGHLRHAGQSFYPPILPGFTTTTSDVVIVGMNAGVPFMTFPPSPFDNGLTYLNGANPDAVLRITLSPKTLGFIRIQTVPLKVIVEPVTDAVRGIKNFIFRRGGSCGALFAGA